MSGYYDLRTVFVDDEGMDMHMNISFSTNLICINSLSKIRPMCWHLTFHKIRDYTCLCKNDTVLFTLSVVFTSVH